MKFLSNMDIDASFKPLGGELPATVKKTITFAGGTTNAWGDDGGTLDGGVLFTVTGLCKVAVLGIVTTDLVGGATEEVGITGNTAIFCAQVTDTVLDLGEIWLNDTTPASSFIIGEEQAAADNLPIYLLNGNDIILTTATTNTTSGVIDFYAYWRPMSSDASLTASAL